MMVELYAGFASIWIAYDWKSSNNILNCFFFVKGQCSTQLAVLIRACLSTSSEIHDAVRADILQKHYHRIQVPLIRSHLGIGYIHHEAAGSACFPTSILERGDADRRGTGSKSIGTLKS